MANTFNHNGKVVITSGGNVGIGTDSPSSALDVSLSGGGTSGIRFKGYSDASTPYLLSLGTESYPDQFQIKSVNGLVTMGIVGATGAAPDLAFQTNTTERMRITSAGNVGIGTTSPSSRLSIQNSGTTDSIISEYRMTNGSNAATFRTDDTTIFGIHSQNNGDIYIKDTSDNVLFYGKNGGNVGIGTTSPAQKLHVVGTSNFQGAVQVTGGTFVDSTRRNIYLDSFSAGGGAGIFFRDGFTYNASITAEDHNGSSADGICISGYDGISFSTGSNSRNEVVRITGGSSNVGMVGIGTTSPTSKFTVTNGNVEIQSNGASSMTNYLKIATHTNGSWGSFIAADSYYNSTLSTNLTLGVSNAGSALNVLHITSAGNVGIGTTSPTQLLSVAGNTDLGNSIGSATSSTYTTRLSGYALYYDASNRYGNYGVLLLNADSGWTSSAKRFMITNGYNANRFAIIRSVDATTDPALGYGGSVTSGTVDFEINSAGAATFGSSVTTVGAIQSGGDIIIQNTYPRIQLIDTDHNSDFAIINNNGNFSIYDDTNSSHRLWIDSTGNVGIGTTSPSYKLDVESSVTPIHLNRTDGNEALIGLETQGTLRGYIGASSTDAFNIYNATPTRMLTVLSGGNVGIGTTTPDYKFEVEGVISSCDAALQKATFANVGSDLVLTANAGATNVTAKILFNSSGAGGASVSTKMIIDGSGNVGIGTTSPSYKLQVNSDAGGYGIVNTNGTVTIGTYIEGSNNYASFGTQSNHGLGFFTNNAAPQMYINTAGNVGIGTTSPAVSLQVNASTAAIRLEETSASSKRLEFSIDSSAVAKISANQSSQSIAFETVGSERMRIASTGNVGIGTTSPSEKLHVVGSTVTVGTSYLFSNTNASYYNSGANDLFHQFESYWDTNSASSIATYRFDVGTWRLWSLGTGSAVVTAKSNGNVGIGTTAPSAKLDVNGDINLTNYGSLTGGNSSNRMAIIKGTGASGNIEIGGLNNSDVIILTHVNERMRITAAGNVGIGTTSPSTNLHVAGSVRVSGNNTNRLDLDGGVRITGQYYANGNTEYTYIDMYNNANASINIGTKHPLSYISFESGNGAYTERMRITNTGNVGIGTTSPTNPLTVTTATNAVDVVRLNNTGGDSGSVQGVTHLAINHFNSGTNPSTRITAYQDSTSGWPGGMYFSTRSLNTDSAPVERMRITSGGNVGIGTSSPQYMLDVNGDAQINASGTGPAYAYVPDGGFGVDNLLTSSTENVALGKPDVWLRIHVDGVAFVFPGYQEP